MQPKVTFILLFWLIKMHGHESENVTKHYLESFGDDVLDKADEHLL